MKQQLLLPQIITKKKSSTPPVLKKPRKQKSVDTKRLLQSLTKEQLVSLIIKHIDSKPECKLDFCNESELPAPDIESLTAELKKLNNKISKSFPHSRFGSHLDHYSYKRVSPAISSFRKTLNQHLAILQKSQRHDSMISWLLSIFPSVSDLPHWDSKNDRKTKTQIITKLAKTFIKSFPYAFADGKYDKEKLEQMKQTLSLDEEEEEEEAKEQMKGAVGLINQALEGKGTTKSKTTPKKKKKVNQEDGDDGDGEDYVDKSSG